MPLRTFRWDLPAPCPWAADFSAYLTLLLFKEKGQALLPNATTQMNPEGRRSTTWFRSDEEPKTVQLLQAENRTVVASPAGRWKQGIAAYKMSVTEGD